MNPELVELIERLNAAIAAEDYEAWGTAWKGTNLGPLDLARAALECEPYLAADRDFETKVAYEARGRAQFLLDHIAKQHGNLGWFA